MSHPPRTPCQAPTHIDATNRRHDQLIQPTDPQSPPTAATTTSRSPPPAATGGPAQPSPGHRPSSNIDPLPVLKIPMLSPLPPLLPQLDLTRFRQLPSGHERSGSWGRGRGARVIERVHRLPEI